MLLLADPAATIATDALVAAAIAAAGAAVLASSMLIAYSARVYTRWRRADGE